MAATVSKVFTGETMEEVNQAIVDEAADLVLPKAVIVGDVGPEPTEPTTTATASKKKAATKKRAAKKKAAAADAEPDPLSILEEDDDDDFGGDGEENSESPADDGGFDDGPGNVELGDVRDALGELAQLTTQKKAQKVLQMFGDSDDLAGLEPALYEKVLVNATKVIEKVKSQQ